MAEQLGRGLQNLVDRCDSGSRLASLFEVYGVTALEACIPLGRCESMLPRGTQRFSAVTTHRAHTKLFGFGWKCEMNFAWVAPAPDCRQAGAGRQGTG